MELKELAIAAYKRQTGFTNVDILVEINSDNLYAFKTISSDYKFKEIFVYSEDFEGIHIRSGDIARGGIRISTRTDYRKEVIDLVLAQIPKNSIVLPTGAKGGIFIKTNIEAEDAYRAYIEALINITEKTDDRYLVVAADKGTATFSDIANDLIEKRNFWIGDAFASGGSFGYDHKKTGITALATWQSLHVRLSALNKNIATDVISIVGIGSMNGDVFGNGVLFSRNIKLVGAFSSKEIFIDPNPDLDVSYDERSRLFYSDNAAWSNYDKSKISTGGGVFSRNDNNIVVTEQMKKVFNIDKSTVTANELICYLLKASVDVLYMGAVGTYVKSTEEVVNFDIENEPIRINASELRCLVIGEGANLGMTLDARREANLRGILVFADFIDNAGGVFLSDTEVNLKILLRGAENRNFMLETLQEYYIQYILKNCFFQALALLQTSRFSNWNLFFEVLKKNINLNGFVFQVNSYSDVAYLLSYAKMYLKKKLLQQSDIEKYDMYVSEYFNFISLANIKNFIYKRELIATYMANDIINHLFSEEESMENIIEKVFGNNHYDIIFKFNNVIQLKIVQN